MNLAKFVKILSFLFVAIFVGIINQVVNGQTEQPIIPIPERAQLINKLTGEKDILQLRMPYNTNQIIEWSGGPHEWGNTNGFSTFQVGRGSGLDFAVPKDSADPKNFEVLNMVDGTLVQIGRAHV